MINSRVGRIVLGALLVATVVPYARAAQPAAERAAGAVVAQAQGTEQPELQPRYEPVPPQPKSSYNGDYIFGMTRGVANSTIHPAGKVPLFVLTIPLDIAFLPFAVIGGFFG